MHPTERSFKIMLEKARHHANRFMQYFFNMQRKMGTAYKPPDFKLENLVLVSNLNFNNIKVPNKMKDLFSGPFMMKELPSPNAVQLEFTGELMTKHTTFPVIMIEPYRTSER
ncbi:hypothetical protein O181_016770 [Austropuccinia psidii MF-1]|uniref:Uncharacterized protein n=1 Tax=Austropuccinia psidii MF-1 TaxID=1389203 RepID=A0A9Q3GSB8_9BASI|nr:hypothetical protein [Austropuccinia psidii MF-1]